MRAGLCRTPAAPATKTIPTRWFSRSWLASATGPSVLAVCYTRLECHSMRLDFLYANPQLIPKIPFKMHFKTSKKQQNSSQNAKIFAARLETCLYQSGRPQRKVGFYHSKAGTKSRGICRASGHLLTTTAKTTLAPSIPAAGNVRSNYLVVIEVFLFAQRGVRVRVGLNYAKLT